MKADYSLFDIFDPKIKAADIAPSDEVTLRPYQKEAVSNVFQQWGDGVTSTLVCLPTGTGKSVVFSEVIRIVCEGIR